MKTIKILFFLCLLLHNIEIINAQQQVSEIEAINAAINTKSYNNKLKTLSISSNNATIDTVYNFSNSGNILMYEVIFSDGTAVLLSGSKACKPILGRYTKPNNDKTSIFDTTNVYVPPGLRDMLNGYSGEIDFCFEEQNMELHYKQEWEELQQAHLLKNNTFTTKAISEVGPLLKTAWGQSWSNDEYIEIKCTAYNHYINKTENKCDACEAEKCPVGCTAVAMGQIMYYWKFPVYHPLLSSQFDWCNMPEALYYRKQIYPYSLNPNYEKERDAVAWLLYRCAEESNTIYCIGECNSFALPDHARNALVNNFGYSSDANFRERRYHSDKIWKEYIKADLDKGRPILYTAVPPWVGNAHTFVCDGYNSNDEFHFNWGWHGDLYDDWYALNAMMDIKGSNYLYMGHSATFEIYPSEYQDHCTFSLPLQVHFSFNSSQQSIPKTFSVLESVPQQLPAAWRTIEPNQTVEYVAHDAVILKPGFHAKAGSNFTAKVEPCRNCTGRTLAKAITINSSMIESEAEEQETYNLSKTYIYKPDDETVVISPNPNEGNFIISLSGNLEDNAVFEIFNLNGQVLYKSSIMENNQNVVFTDSPGVYVIKIINGKKTYIDRFILK
jgi:hypothetical protein